MPYDFVHHTEARVFEVLMPSKYRPQIEHVVDAFFDITEFARIPQVKEYCGEDKELLGNMMDLCRCCITGYSTYEVDGRFWSNETGELIDEKTTVVRFIVTDLTLDGPLAQQVGQCAEHILVEFLTRRLAKGIGTEEEVWMVEYGKSQVYRWVRANEKRKKAEIAARRICERMKNLPDHMQLLAVRYIEDRDKKLTTEHIVTDFAELSEDHVALPGEDWYNVIDGILDLYDYDQKHRLKCVWMFNVIFQACDKFARDNWLVKQNGQYEVTREHLQGLAAEYPGDLIAWQKDA